MATRARPTTKKSTAKKAARKRRGSPMKLILILVVIAVLVVVALDQFGVIVLPFIPQFLGGKAEPEAVDLEEEVAEEEPDLAEEPETGVVRQATPTPVPPGGVKILPSVDLAAEERRDRQVQADIIADLSPEKAAEALEQMPETDQVAILRALDAKDAAKILEQVEAEERARLLAAIGPGLTILEE